MRLRRLDLLRYGKFTDRAIDFGEKVDGGPDLHIVYGLNEAGKSTALSAYLDLLFGIEERSRYGFLHPYGAMEVGAVLDFAGSRHELRRVKQRSGSLRDASGRPTGETILGGALSGLTRDAYRMMFSLDDQTLVDGGNAILESKGDLGELLFSASAGLVDLSMALALVAAEADRIFRKRASTTEIAGLKRRLAELRAERDKIDTHASAYAGLVTELRRAEKAYDEAVRERGELKARLNELGSLMRAVPLAADHSRLLESVAAFADLPRPPGHWADELPALMVGDATLSTALRGKDEQIARLRAEIEGIEVDPDILRLGDRIEALTLLASRFQTAETDLPRRRIALAATRDRLAGVARSVTGDVVTEPDTLIVDVATLGNLRSLLEEWSGIGTQLAAAADELDGASVALDEALTERSGLDRIKPPLDLSQRAILETGVQRLREGDLLAGRRMTAKAVSARARSLDQALRALGSWPGDAEGLAELALPSAWQVKAWRDTLAEHELRHVRHRERRRELVSALAELEASAVVTETAAGAIGDVEAGILREARDRAWTAHRESPDADTAAAFERSMRAVDAMSDARLANADQLAELRGLKRELGVKKARLEVEARHLAEIEQETADLAIRIEEAWPTAVPIAPAKPVAERLIDMEAWTVRRDRVVSALDELRTARAEAEDVEAEIEGEVRRLAEAIGGGEPDLARSDAAALLQAAEAMLAADVAQAQARGTADKLVRDLTQTLEGRRKAADAATAAMADWEVRWANALSGSWLAAHTKDRGAVRAIADLVADLPALLAERNGIQHRIDAMETDREAFLTELEALYRDLGEAPGARGVVEAMALRDRHAAAGRAYADRGDRERRHVELEEERFELLGQTAIHAARKSEILDFFRSKTLTEVSALLDRCSHRDRIEEELRQVSARIVQETGAATPDAAMRRIDERGGQARFAAEHDECLKRIDDLDTRLQGLFAAKSNASDRLGAVGGDDAVARIDSERRTVTLQIEDKVERFLHLRAGALLADRALQVYRDKHRGSMMSRASETFRAITRDAYVGLTTRPDKDRETLIGLTGSGGSKLAIEMSKGTRFQLYLALRLAGYEEFASARQAVPFVADDIMESFDEPRSEEVLSLFGKMSSVGQVIYLTHHRHICELARKVVPDVRVHELSP
jgi:uncharacterized protein YhaN